MAVRKIICNEEYVNEKLQTKTLSASQLNNDSNKFGPPFIDWLLSDQASEIIEDKYYGFVTNYIDNEAEISDQVKSATFVLIGTHVNKMGKTIEDWVPLYTELDFEDEDFYEDLKSPNEMRIINSKGIDEEAEKNDYLESLAKELSDASTMVSVEEARILMEKEIHRAEETNKLLLKKSAEWREERRKYLRDNNFDVKSERTGKNVKYRCKYDYERRKREYEEFKAIKEENASMPEEKERLENEARDKLKKTMLKKIGAENERKVKEKVKENYYLYENKVHNRALEMIATSRGKDLYGSKIRYNLIRQPVNIPEYDEHMDRAIEMSIDRGPGRVQPTSSMKVVDGAFLFYPKYTYDKPSKMRVYKRRTALTPAKVAKIYMFDRLYGCLVAATFFQILVSNTPIDEDYTYNSSVQRLYRNRWVKKTEGSGLNMKPKDPDVYANEVLENQFVEYDVRRTHKADDKYVRADWLLTFRGVTFKAWDSTPEPYSEPNTASVYIGREYFDNKADEFSIASIANILLDNTPEDNFETTFKYHNINPRWELLEKGGYLKDSKPRVGSQYGYLHGVTDNFTYQAPMGFIRVTEALWEVLVNSGRWAGYVSNFINGRKNKLDVSNLNSELMKQLIAYDNEIGQKQFKESELTIKM